MVGEGGFEPPKALPADLQSVPFGHSGIPPYSIHLLVSLRAEPSGAGLRGKGDTAEGASFRDASRKRDDP